MGLAEKRVVKAFQEGTYQELITQLKNTIGKEVEIEVKWDTLTENGNSHLFEESWTKVYFNPLTQAIESICADDMGKEAIVESLNKIVITNESDRYSPSSWSTFEDSVLTLDHLPTTNVDDVDERAQALQEVLEENL